MKNILNASNNAPQGVSAASPNIKVFTEEDVRAWEAALASGHWDWEGNPISDKPNRPPTGDGLSSLDCDRGYHQWKEYNGFNEDYKYCVKCDKKEITKGDV